MQNWDKKIHVHSSLPARENQYAMFIGRWQLLHPGHKEMFQQAIDAGKRVLICIRDIEPDEKNPWTPQQILINVSNELKSLIEAGKVKIMIIPDICSVEFGRGVGYDIIEHVPPAAVAEISATKIREQMRKEGKL